MSPRPPRRARLLSREEAHLWGEIAKLITPLRGRAKPKKALQKALSVEAERPSAPPRPNPAAPAPATVRPVPKTAVKRPSPSRLPVASPPPAPPAQAATPRPAVAKPLKLGDLAPQIARVQATPPPPAPPTAPGLERRERRGLERGTLTIEARIDLHGLYQAEAHAALVGFLLRSRAAGHARVLVVTGKGGEGFGGQDRGFSERGVLRRSVPHWLRGPELRGLVLGFEEAARHHGGAGALYIRLRRR
ncbi:MAG TPA: Smr/MutS family protein [Methylorubrum populi]|uniref:Smr/MutS family protein n=1 Tax=Methylorubrum populi TaxID=223967 RepID=A0A921E2B2_9HYPH|nr:Smr/MutS family protein [Methylorubrum populi]